MSLYQQRAAKSVELQSIQSTRTCSTSFSNHYLMVLRECRLCDSTGSTLELSTVAHVLRIGIEDSEPSYRREIFIKEIDKLCSNSLSKEDSDHLSWTHASPRDFVVRVILNPAIDLAESSAKEASMKSNHLLVANTFIAVMRVSDHPVWKELDLDPSQW